MKYTINYTGLGPKIKKDALENNKLYKVTREESDDVEGYCFSYDNYIDRQRITVINRFGVLVTSTMHNSHDFQEVYGYTLTLTNFGESDALEGMPG